jgi:hypothetical protein
MDTSLALLNGISFLPLIGLSVLAFCKPTPMLFAMLSGLAMIMGLNAPDMLAPATNNVGLAAGWSLIMYSFLCIGLTYWYQLRGT